MKHSITVKFKNITLRPVEYSDTEQLRIWRNDKENTKFLRRIGYITKEQQEIWYKNYLSNESEIMFAIEETDTLDRMVGSLSLYDIGKDTLEIGKILIGDREAHGKGIGRISFVMAMWVAFKKLNVEKITASVHRNNISAYTNYMRIGFAVTGCHEALDGGTEDELEMDIQRLIEANGYVTEIEFI